MDKNRARITIKLGQAKEEQPKTGLRSGHHVKKLRDQNELEPVELQEETQHILEDLPAKQEIAVGEETTNDEELFGPKYVPEKTDRPKLTNRRSYKSRLRSSREEGVKGYMGMLASIVGAVVLGLIFGFIVLSFFKSGLLDKQIVKSTMIPPAMQKEDKTSDGQQVPAEENELGDPASQEGQAGAVEPTTTMSITIPASSYFVVQGGVFQDQASASPILDTIKNNGWPNHFWGDNPAYLFLGIAANRDNALAIANQYDGMDVFIKEMSQEPETISIDLKQGQSLTQEEWEKWLEHEHLFIQTLGKAIGEGLTTNKLEQDQMKSVTEAHRTLLQLGREMMSKLPAQKQSLGNRLLNDFTKGVTAMERYQKQPSVGYLWQAEQALLDAFGSKQDFFASFK